MGLFCSHDAFEGAYSAFNRLRQCIAYAIGGSYPPHYVYDSKGDTILGKNGLFLQNDELNGNLVYFPDKFPEGHEEGFKLFLLHSDCDGELTPEECLKVANALESILPKIENMNWPSYGHIEAYGGYTEVTKKFIKGCRLAFSLNEPLTFS